MNVHPAEFGTAMQRREDLAGIEQLRRIKGAFHALLVRQIRFGEHLGHQVPLFHPDAVLAGQHTAHLDAQPQYVRAEGFCLFEIARAVGIVEDQRVQIAVARMEDVGDAEPIASRQRGHALEHLGQSATGIVPSMQ